MFDMSITLDPDVGNGTKEEGQIIDETEMVFCEYILFQSVCMTHIFVFVNTGQKMEVKQFTNCIFHSSRYTFDP